jgi:integrase
MAVDNLWYLTKRDPKTGDKLPSKRHGRGKRWRVRWNDPETGAPRTELYERKVDAERHDANTQADISRGQYIDPRAGKATVAEYAETWRKQQLHRKSTAERAESAVRLHVIPILGKLPLSAVRSSHIKGWVKDRSSKLGPSTLRMVYSNTLLPMFASAVVDRKIGVSPCVGIRLPEVDGSDIATPEQVHALHEALPERYRPIPYVAAGCGWRAGEVLGTELNHVDFDAREMHVRQQLVVLSGRQPFLAPPKAKTSRRTNELPTLVTNVL